MLNPKDVEDSFYLEGQPAPAKGDTYFGVFMYVTNEDSDRRILPIGTEDMKIVTASGEEFEPIEVKAPGWGYAPSPIGTDAMLPVAEHSGLRRPDPRWTGSLPRVAGRARQPVRSSSRSSRVTAKTRHRSRSTSSPRAAEAAAGRLMVGVVLLPAIISA